MPNSLLLQLSRRDRLSDDESNLLLGSFSGERSFHAGQDIVSQGARPTSSQLLVEGFAGRYKILANGSRQITAMHIPGDFMDLHGFLLKTLAHGVFALSACRVALVEHEALRRITEMSPHLSRLLWLDTLIDGSVHREWLVAMGRRSSEAQLAHLLCEIFVRMQIVDRVDGYSFDLPLTQVELADVLGLSVVHVNRTLQKLRRQGAVTWDGMRVRIDDWAKLASTADFDPAYLCLDNEPR